LETTRERTKRVLETLKERNKGLSIITREIKKTNERKDLLEKTLRIIMEIR